MLKAVFRGWSNEYITCNHRRQDTVCTEPVPTTNRLEDLMEYLVAPFTFNLTCVGHPPDSAPTSMFLHAAEPTKLAAVVYTYVDGMVDKRAPYRSDHLDLLKTMTEEGTCLLGDLGSVGTLFLGMSRRCCCCCWYILLSPSR